VIAQEPHRSRSGHGRRKWSITLAKWQVQMHLRDSRGSAMPKAYGSRICVTRRLEFHFPNPYLEHSVIVNS
jgi:hypothetical protein